MPVHIPALAAAAAGYISAADCLNAEDVSDEEIVFHEADEDTSKRAESSGRSVRFSPCTDDTTSSFAPGRQKARLDRQLSPRIDIDDSIRSMVYSEQAMGRSIGSQREHQMTLQLKAMSASFDHESSPPSLTAPGMVYQDSSFQGFCDGDFASGKVKNIRLNSECWVIGYNSTSSVLAVGLKRRIDFLETMNYKCIYSIPFAGTVSAIEWGTTEVLYEHKTISPTASRSDSQTDSHDVEAGELVAVAGLTGRVTLYHVNIPLLELQGPTELHSFQVSGEIRSMALQYFEKHHSLLLAVGDASGAITLSTLAKDQGSGLLREVNRVVEDEGFNNTILGLAIHSENTEFLVATCKDGTIAVHQICMHVPSSFVNGLNIKNHSQSFLAMGEELWCTQRSGPVRAIVICHDGTHFAFGGYDKTLVLVDTNLWAIVREISLQGTINTISFDRLHRFMAVGCRDKSLTLFDTSTFVAVKRWETRGWVTDASWAIPGLFSDLVVIRSQEQGLSVIDLTPTHISDITKISRQEGSEGCGVSWSPDGHFLASINGDKIVVSDSRFGFSKVASCDVLKGSMLKQIQFCPVLHHDDGGDNDDVDLNPNSKDVKGKDSALLLAAIGLNGYLQILELKCEHAVVTFEIIQAKYIEPNLWVVQWANNGQRLFVGGKSESLNIVMREKLLQQTDPIPLDSSLWSIACMKNANFAVASGNKAVIYDSDTFEATLQVMRPRAVRCLCSHPTLHILAIGDDDGTIAIVDYDLEETLLEVEVTGRVNCLEFSPTGDFLLIGTDECIFKLCETKTYKVLQVFPKNGFAICAGFSSNGKYLILGSVNDAYSLIRLGPFLGIDYVPLSDKNELSQLPNWALNETLFRSGFGPSLLQRQMDIGNRESLKWVAKSLKDYPNAIYSVNRSRNETCFDTAIRLRKIKLLKLAVTTMVDGSVETSMEGQRSILTSNIPEMGLGALNYMLLNHPPGLVVEILREMKFVKVPFTRPHAVLNETDKYLSGSHTYLDPWKNKTKSPDDTNDSGHVFRTAAVLPLPGLGSFEFLSLLILRAPATAFDNEAMGLVLKVLWRYHIRTYFMIDTVIFATHYCLWTILADIMTSPTQYLSSTKSKQAVASATMILNTMFLVKECIQSNLGRRAGYFSSLWNAVDLLSCLLVYIFTFMVVSETDFKDATIPIAVLTCLLLTVKLISYLRAFHDTGWLVAVLNQNFHDVKGFLVILLVILVGFSASFRLVFGRYQADCDAIFESDGGNLVAGCDDRPFGSLRRSFLSTFELTILGSYDPQLLYENNNTLLAAMLFVLAVTCVLVVALNALISVLADSYDRVQENATANRRKERAELIVEYMTLLPKRKLKQIEKNTRYFHALLEADAEGDLVVDTDDWRGGLNALREDIEELNQAQAEATKRALDELRTDIDRDIGSFKKEVFIILREISSDVKRIQKNQRVGAGRRVAGAVKQIGHKIGGAYETKRRMPQPRDRKSP